MFSRDICGTWRGKEVVVGGGRGDKGWWYNFHGSAGVDPFRYLNHTYTYSVISAFLSSIGSVLLCSLV